MFICSKAKSVGKNKISTNKLFFNANEQKSFNWN